MNLEALEKFVVDSVNESPELLGDTERLEKLVVDSVNESPELLEEFLKEFGGV